MKVSLVVPLRNEATTVGALLESVSLQIRPPDEVVVVDAGSEDGTAALVSSSEAPIPTRLIRTGGLYPGLARNAGVEAAAHPWLAFTDGGIRLDPSWLHELLAAAEAESADVVFGSYDPACAGFFRQCAAVAYVPPPGREGIRGPSVASMALKREVFVRAGGFPPYRAAEDLIFLERIVRLGVRVAHAPRALVHWELAPDARATFRRFALYSEHNLRAGRGRYWHRGVLRHYALIAVATAAVAAAGGGAWSALVYPAWQTARAARSAWSKRRAFRDFAIGPGHVLGAAALLCLVDAATLWGAVRWARDGGKAGR